MTAAQRLTPERVLRIDPASGGVSLVGPATPGDDKWQGGVLGDDGAIYGIPERCRRVLKIVPPHPCPEDAQPPRR